MFSDAPTDALTGKIRLELDFVASVSTEFRLSREHGVQRIARPGLDRKTYKFPLSIRHGQYLILSTKRLANRFPNRCKHGCDELCRSSDYTHHNAARAHGGADVIDF